MGSLKEDTKGITDGDIVCIVSIPLTCGDRSESRGAVSQE